ncbi:MAG: HAD hydrolase family protein [Acholeplasmatales bacterium]|jgi:hydroxymethylpyrimidine pyrophosphatase-like HAD family hydrolase|nr:HAD hydrolase family protein [Acholeplasmatales bacterium]
MKKIIFPKIGARIIKTAIAVAIVFLVDIMLNIFVPALRTLYFNAFFAGLAACYSITNSRESTVKFGSIRAFGTIIGGVVGLVTLYAIDGVNLIFKFDKLGSTYLTLGYLLALLFLVILIWITVLIKKTTLTFVACLTFLSVAVSGRNGLGYWEFALNRTLSTIIGVLIAVNINFFRLHFFKNKNVAYVISIDGVLLKKNQYDLTNFQRFYLTSLINDGMNVYFASTRTRSSMAKMFEGLGINHPIVSMNGAVTYDPNTNIYSNLVYFKTKDRIEIEKILDKHNVNYFSHAINDNILTIYYKHLINEGETRFYNERKLNFRNFARADVPSDLSVNYYLIIDTIEVIRVLAKELKNMVPLLHCDVYTSEAEGFYRLKIGYNYVNKVTGLEKIIPPNTKIISFVGNLSDIPLIDISYKTYCLNNVPIALKKKVSNVIDSDDTNKMAKVIRNSYYRNNEIKKEKKEKK